MIALALFIRPIISGCLKELLNLFNKDAYYYSITTYGGLAGNAVY